MIKGTQNPAVGTDEIYQYIDSLDIFNSSDATYIWYIWKKKQGKWVDITIKPPKMGQKVPFNFGEKVIGEEFKLEVFKAIPIFGSDDFKAKSVGEIVIIPASSKIPKITKVELLYVDDTKGATFSFMEKLRVKANCVGLFGKELVFTLWEDDAEKSGHNTKNLFIDSKRGKINSKGISVAEFTLSKALMHKAMQGEADAKQLEFYVTVEYFKNNKLATQNVNINNPFPQKTTKPPNPVSTSATPRTQPKAKGSPAASKPTSKKEQKGIWNTITESASKFGSELHDYFEVKAKAAWDQLPTFSAPEGDSINQVKSGANKKDATNCICKEQYKDLIWGEKVSCKFRQKVFKIAQGLNKDPNLLMAGMALETGRTFSPTAGKGSNFVGLIQFGGDAAASVGTTRQELLKMSALDQLDYVEKYLDKKKDKINTLTDFYLSIIMPVDVGMGKTPKHEVFNNEYPLVYKKNGKLTDLRKSRHFGYRQNATFMHEGEIHKNIKIKRSNGKTVSFKELSDEKKYGMKMEKKIMMVKE